MPRNIFIATVFLAGVLAGLLIPWFGGVYAVQTERPSVDASGAGVASTEQVSPRPGPTETVVPGTLESEAEAGQSADATDAADATDGADGADAAIETDTPLPRGPHVLTLAWSALQNATYPGWGFFSRHRITLVDGVGGGPNNAGLFVVPRFRMVDVHAIGDLDGDGADDAVVILTVSLGGSGMYYDIVPVVNWGGAPYALPGLRIDDRARIESMVIIDGRITLVAYIHGASPLCCPSRLVALEYVLVDRKLEQTGMIDLTELPD